jgi:hypothetical protein
VPRWSAAIGQRGCAQPRARARARGRPRRGRGPLSRKPPNATRSPMIQRAAASSGRMLFTPVLDSRTTASRTTRTPRAKRPPSRRFRARTAQPRCERGTEDETSDVARTVMGALLLSASSRLEADYSDAECGLGQRAKIQASARTCSEHSWGRLRRTGRAPLSRRHGLAKSVADRSRESGRERAGHSWIDYARGAQAAEKMLHLSFSGTVY